MEAAIKIYENYMESLIILEKGKDANCAPTYDELKQAHKEMKAKCLS